jgi:hypothetical protein
MYAWPWEAKAPVPFAFIADAVKASALAKEVWMTVRQSMECLAYWSATSVHNWDSGRRNNWKDAVLHCLATPPPHMEQLVQGVIRNLGIVGTSHYYCIPVLKLPRESMETLNRRDGTAQPDSLETLFIRVNSEGTPLEGEELNYSILKSIYPKAEELVEKLSTSLMPPARLVTFVSRLVLATSDDGRTANTPPPEPNVARFRRLVHGNDQPFAAGMRRYIGLNESDDRTNDKSYAATLLKHAKDLLTWSANPCTSYRLPSVLVTDLARRSQDAFFVLLVWLDRMLSTGQSLENIDDADKRRIVGVITTLGWFALKPDKCLETLWERLTKSDPKNFFAPGVLRQCLQPTDRGELHLIPPLPPPLLQEAIEQFVTLKPGFSDPAHVFWQEWQWWSHFANKISKISNVHDWFGQNLPSWSDDGAHRACYGWVDRLKRMPQRPSPLVLYAQRQWLVEWFPEYDPVRADQLEDTDRPWDMDHIHPGNYVNGKWYIPQIIKDWHSCIGNLRA